MKDLAEEIGFRSDFYRFLSSLFLKEPPLELLATLSSLAPPGGKSMKDIEGLLPPKDSLLESFKEQLDVDFARTFLGAGSRSAFPYESVYRSRLGLLMQEPAAEVRAFYRRAGLAKSSSLPEPDDHLGVELAFMAHLADQTGRALADGRKPEALAALRQQVDFLYKHLSTWVPSFCQDVQALASTEFYKSLASLLKSWVNSDRLELDRLLKSAEAKS